MQTTWLRAVSQISEWTLLFLTPLVMSELWRWRSVPALKGTKDPLVRSVLKDIVEPLLVFTWALVRGVTVTVMPAAAILRLAHVCNVSITLLGQSVIAVRLVTTETLLRVVLRPANPALVLELHPITNFPRPVTWALMANLLVTAALLDSLADVVRDVLQDTLATHCLDRDAPMTIQSMVTVTTVTKVEVKAASVVCAAAR